MKFTYSPSGKICSSLTGHQRKYAVVPLATRKNLQFTFLPPEKICSSLTRHQKKYSLPTRHQSKYRVYLATTGEIYISPSHHHRRKHAVHVLATGGNTQFIYSSPEQIDLRFKCSLQRQMNLQFSYLPSDEIDIFWSLGDIRHIRLLSTVNRICEFSGVTHVTPSSRYWKHLAEPGTCRQWVCTCSKFCCSESVTVRS